MPPNPTKILITSSYAAVGTTLIHIHNGNASSSTPRMCVQSRYSHLTVPSGATCGQNCRPFWAEYRCSLSSNRCHFATSRGMSLPEVLSSSYRPLLPSSTSPSSTIPCTLIHGTFSVRPSLGYLSGRPPLRISACPSGLGRTYTPDVRGCATSKSLPKSIPAGSTTLPGSPRCRTFRYLCTISSP